MHVTADFTNSAAAEHSPVLNGFQPRAEHGGYLHSLAVFVCLAVSHEPPHVLMCSLKTHSGLHNSHDFIRTHPGARAPSCMPELGPSVVLSCTVSCDRHAWLWLQGMLGTWVEVETAGAMLQHLLAGCAQQLYTPREFCALYWWAVLLPGVLRCVDACLWVP
jgi:hypothetical protein